MVPDDDRAGTADRGAMTRDAVLFRHAFDKAPVPATITRVKTGEFLHVNAAFTQTFGWTREEIVGKSSLDVGILSDPEVRAHIVDEVRRHGSVTDAEIDLETKSGEPVRALVSVETIDAGGEVLLLATIQDVRARGALERALQGQQQLVGAILDAAADAIVGLDASNCVILVNQAGASMLGYELHELHGQNFHDIAHHSRPDGSPYPRDECPLYRTTTRGEAHQVEGEVFWRKDGMAVPVEYSTSPVIVNGEVEGATVVARDVTAQIEARWILEESMRRAEDASRAKSDFLSHMSHELRTPLNAVLGFTELLSMRVTDPDVVADLLQIERAGHHLLNLINDVLDISRIEAGQLALSAEPTALLEIVAEVISLIGPTAEEADVAIRTKVTPDVYVQADLQRLRQVLLNLVSNGIKYNRPGGWVEVSAQRRGGQVEVAVRDTGRGVNPARLPRLFEPFERVTGDRSGVDGTGLGLALSQRLVHAMQGSLEVESVEGEGAVFTVVLPRAEAVLPVSEHLPPIEYVPPITPMAPPTRAVVVLYVEDNPANMRLVEAALRTRPGARLIPATTGGLGVELAVRNSPNLVLLDLHLPDMSGEEVLRRLRADERTQGCRVVMLSADATKERIQRLLASGADAYLTKPVKLASLFQEIDGIVASSASREPEATA